MHEVAAHLQFLREFHARRSLDVRVAILVAVALRVVLHRLTQRAGDAYIVHHQAAFLLGEHAIDACDGLHQVVPLHGFVHVHRGQARHVEPRQPHVHHDGNLHRRLIVLEQLRVFFVRAVVDELVPFLTVLVARAGHHVHFLRPRGSHFQQPLVDLKRCQLVVGHDHRLARQFVGAVLLVVLHDVVAEAADGGVAAQQPLDAAVVVLRFIGLLRRCALRGQFVEGLVQQAQLVLVEVQVDDAALVVHGPCSTVGHSLRHVVHVDVVAEHLLRVAVAVGDGRAREAHEHGVGQRLAHQSREALPHPLALLVPMLLAVLRAVRLVGDYDDVAAVR